MSILAPIFVVSWFLLKTLKRIFENNECSFWDFFFSLLCLFLYILDFAALYQIFGLNNPTTALAGGLAQPSNGFYAIYFSLSCLTGLNFGDVVPANSATRVIASIEGLLSYLVFGFFVSVFPLMLKGAFSGRKNNVYAQVDEHKVPSLVSYKNKKILNLKRSKNKKIN